MSIRSELNLNRSTLVLQHKLADAAVLEEDATAFDYDGVYDTLKKPAETKAVVTLGANAEGGLSKPHVGLSGTEDQKHKVREKPKYIRKLLEKAEEKKREWDLVMERKMEAERLEDEHLHGDQPKYVTKAYKEHLVESNKWKAIEEEREKREAKEDVRKRGDLTSFYSNLLNNNVAFGGEQAESTTSHELSADAKQRVLEKLTARGRNVDGEDIAGVIESKENHTLKVDPETPVEAAWSKKLEKAHSVAPTEVKTATQQSSPKGATEEPPAEEDDEILHLKAALAAAKAKKERQEPSGDNNGKRTATEAFGETAPAVSGPKKQPKEPEPIDLSARNKESAVDDAKARYLARKKAKEDAAKQKK